MDTVRLTCINCPLGCPLEVKLDRGQVLSVTGNTCPRGDAYGRKEVSHPTRIVTSTVPVRHSNLSRVSVKTSTDIPKDMIFTCMKEIRSLTVEAPVHMGQVLRSNIAGTDADLVATSGAEKER